MQGAMRGQHGSRIVTAGEESTQEVRGSLDPVQFAYRPNHSTEDAISAALHLTLEHLENNNALVRMLFVDFSSAFNTIIPQHLIYRPGPVGLNTRLQNWIRDFNRQAAIGSGTE